MSKIIVLASFKPKEGMEDKVLATLNTMAAPTRAEAGCEKYDLYRDKEGTGLHLFEVYSDMAAVEAHRAADYYKAYRAMIVDYLAEPIAVKLLAGVDVVGG
jgi:quinol monooxygenase YgiN